MKNHYTISEFYLLLKLGIFRGGNVANWGYISHDKGVLPLLRKLPETYRDELYKKQLGTGLYLLDIYLHNKYRSKLGEYILVISVSRMAIPGKEYTYILKLISEHDTHYLKTAVTKGILSRKRTSVFRKKPGRAIFDSKPFNSIERKH